jgi:hypothetical protein
VLPSNDDPCVWRAEPSFKTKSIYGSENIHGNPSGSYNKIEEGGEYKSKDGLEPVFWFHLPVKLAVEFCHDWTVERICHLTASDGWFIVAGLLCRVPGVYIAMSEAHATGMLDHAVDEVFRLAQDQELGSWLYSPLLVKTLSEHDAEVAKKKEKEVSKDDKLTVNKTKPVSESAGAKSAKVAKTESVVGVKAEKEEKKAVKKKKDEHEKEPAKKKTKKSGKSKKKKKSDNSSSSSSGWSDGDGSDSSL